MQYLSRATSAVAICAHTWKRPDTLVSGECFGAGLTLCWASMTTSFRGLPYALRAFGLCARDSYVTQRRPTDPPIRTPKASNVTGFVDSQSGFAQLT